MPTKTDPSAEHIPDHTPDPRLAAFTDDEIRAEYVARIYGRVADITASKARCTTAKAYHQRNTPERRCAECRYCGRGRCTSTQVYSSSTVCFLHPKKVPGIYYAINPTLPACPEFQPKQTQQ